MISLKNRLGVNRLKEIYVILLVISSFISIALFELFVVFGVVYGIYCLFKEFSQRRLEGNLALPILLYSTVTVTSTALFASKNFVKSLEEGLYQLIYFFEVPSQIRFVKNLVYLFLLMGIFISGLVWYNYFKLGFTKGFWGGEFEIGQYYAEISLILFVILIGFLQKIFREKTFSSRFWYFAVGGIVLFGYFVMILIFSTKRSPILGFMVVFLFILAVMVKNKLLAKKHIFITILMIFITLFAGYKYLSSKDIRYKALTEVILGKKDFSKKTLSVITSSRSKIFLDGLKVVEYEIENKKYINLIIGNGIRPGYYLPHWHTSKSCTRYESIFILSEFIEKGLLGLLAELFIILGAFKTAYNSRIRNLDDCFAFSLYVPLLVHLVGVSFTFFWDALLPMYFLLFRIGEKHFYNG